MRKSRSLLLLSIAVLPLSAQAAGYDCTRAETASEIAVCDNPGLSRLDEEMTTQYRYLINTLPPHRAHLLREDQRSWIVARDSCGADVRCLRARYQERNARLNEY